MVFAKFLLIAAIVSVVVVALILRVKRRREARAQRKLQEGTWFVGD